MTRALWIIGFSITVFMFGLFAVLSLVALVTHRFLSLAAWATLITFGSSAYFIFGRLRAAIRYGDPTKDFENGDATKFREPDPETRSR
jgi:hypothetical protein